MRSDAPRSTVPRALQRSCEWTKRVGHRTCLARRHRAFLVGAVLLLAACSARPASDVLQPVDRAPSFTEKVDIMVATTRAVGDERHPFVATGRAADLNYGSHTVSIPTHHTLGQIEWPNQSPPDPAYHFLTTERKLLDQTAYHRALRQRVSQSGAGAGRVLIFVHGYNMRYQEAVYWLAQIAHDAHYEGVPVLFAWPSQGQAPLYIADRESANYSRDYFEAALREIAAEPAVRHIDILAHSMGAWLLVETLRQARMKGDVDFNGKLANVVLAAPDIDVNVFRTQLDVIGRLPQPMTIVVSGNDSVLALSSVLNGGMDRVGLVEASDARALAAVERYNLRVIDITAVHDGESLEHNKFAHSAKVIAALGQGLAANAPEAQGGTGVAVAVTDLGNSLIKVPMTILGLPTLKAPQ